ncbi:hypothetical protein BJ944DRAFT_271196 [Cunninghamella echinulata]|nr:hypothetical protein BJ944DRAFT_271196 [Cunninghamella echinulata]
MKFVHLVLISINWRLIIFVWITTSVLDCHFNVYLAKKTPIRICMISKCVHHVIMVLMHYLVHLLVLNVW